MHGGTAQLSVLDGGWRWLTHHILLPPLQYFTFLALVSDHSSIGRGHQVPVSVTWAADTAGSVMFSLSVIAIMTASEPRCFPPCVSGASIMRSGNTINPWTLNAHNLPLLKLLERERWVLHSSGGCGSDGDITDSEWNMRSCGLIKEGV